MPPTPFPVSRIEDDEDGTPVRAYDLQGRLMRPFPSTGEIVPGLSPLPARSTGREWVEAFVVNSTKRAQRLQTLERQFGKGTKVGTLIQYTRRDTDSSTDLFVDSRLAVPVQNDVTRGGAHVHRTFAYGATRDLSVARIAIHSETRASDSGNRAVSDTTFSNICLVRR